MKNGFHLMGRRIDVHMRLNQNRYLEFGAKLGGGGIMVWAQVMPNGLLSYRLLGNSYKAHY